MSFELTPLRQPLLSQEEREAAQQTEGKQKDEKKKTINPFPAITKLIEVHKAPFFLYESDKSMGIWFNVTGSSGASGRLLISCSRLRDPSDPNLDVTVKTPKKDGRWDTTKITSGDTLKISPVIQRILAGSHDSWNLSRPAAPNN